MLSRLTKGGAAPIAVAEQRRLRLGAVGVVVVRVGRRFRRHEVDRRPPGDGRRGRFGSPARCPGRPGVRFEVRFLRFRPAELSAQVVVAVAHGKISSESQTKSCSWESRPSSSIDYTITSRQPRCVPCAVANNPRGRPRRSSRRMRPSATRGGCALRAPAPTARCTVTSGRIPTAHDAVASRIPPCFQGVRDG